jgi:hypothetical protein
MFDGNASSQKIVDKETADNKDKDNVEFVENVNRAE